MAGKLERHIKNFNFRGVGGPHVTPQVEDVKYIIILPNLKPKFNFMHILVINEDILGTFGALHV